MNPNVFRKGDAPSCLVVDASWEDVINQPAFFTELAVRIVGMTDEAEKIGLLRKATTLGKTKEAINSILLEPLREDTETSETPVLRKPNTILVDAFWDEIKKSGHTWEKFTEALQKAADMRARILEGQPLSNSATLQDVKDEFNNTIVKPLTGIEK